MIIPDNNASQVSNYSTKTSGPAVARACKGGSGTYAEKGGRAAASSRNGSAWSKSVAYGGDSDDGKCGTNQVSSKDQYVYTSGNATAGVVKGGTFAYAGKGGYGEAVYREGSKFSASIAYGGSKKEGSTRVQYGLEASYPSSGDDGEDSDDQRSL